MSSAVKLILGVSISALATGFAACDNGTTDNGGTAGSGVVVIAGAGNGVAGSSPQTGGGGAPAATAGTGSGGAPVGTAGGPTGAAGTPSDLLPGIALTPTDGWVAVDSNSLMIQGAVYAYADDTSAVGMTSDFTLTNACMKGTAAKVIEPCTIAATATDCYGTYWGAAIGLNLNQPIDPATMEGVKDPLPFDASMIKGFAFVISGNTVPAPAALRFKVENAAGEFCTPTAQKVKVGANAFEFKDLLAECWHVTDPANATAETAQTALTKISWAVVTSKTAEVPFDFCVSDIRAIPK